MSPARGDRMPRSTNRHRLVSTSSYGADAPGAIRTFFENLYWGVSESGCPDLQGGIEMAGALIPAAPDGAWRHRRIAFPGLTARANSGRSCGADLPLSFRQLFRRQAERLARTLIE